MKAEHKEIMNRLEAFLEQPDAHHLRFWQALFASSVVVFESKPLPDGNFKIKDDYNLSDKDVLNRMK